MLLRCLPLLAALVLAPQAERPRFQPNEGSQVRRTLEWGMEMDLESSSMTLNGEEWEQEPEDFQSVQSERYEIVDTFVRVGGGRPLELVRRFESLGGTSKEVYDGEGEEETHESELEGLSVRFLWNEEEERFDVAFVGDDEEDEALLEHLEEDMDLRGFLPPREVAEGDTWEVEIAALVRAFSPGGDLKVKGDEDMAEAFGRQFDEHLEGEVRAAARGTATEAGRRLFKIGLRADVETWAEAEIGLDEDEDGDAGTSTMRVELRFALEGELAWDLEAGRARSFELTGPVECTFRNASRYEMEEGTFEVLATMEMKGTYRSTAKVEPVE